MEIKIYFVKRRHVIHNLQIKCIFFYDDAKGIDGCLQNKETIFDCSNESPLIFTCCHVDVPFLSVSTKDFRHTGHVLRLQIKPSKVGREKRCVSPLGLPLSTPFIYIRFWCKRVSQNRRSIALLLMSFVIGFSDSFFPHVNLKRRWLKQRQVV
jgi:hypothetical protein